MDRIDYLLALALDSGDIPAEATPAEREELLAMLASASVLRDAADEAEHESRASMPVARARFERFLDGQSRPAPTPVSVKPVRRGILGWLPNGARSAGLALAGVAVLVLLGVGGSRLAFQTATTAEALTPGDYVQVQGTISSAADENGARVFKVDSELGELTIDAALATPVVSDGASTDAAHLAPGDSILISGVVKAKTRVLAQTLALAKDAPPQPRKLTFKELKQLRPNLAGRVVVLTLSADALRGRVLIETRDGERLLVTVDANSAGRLLELTAALGARVAVVQPAGGTSGEFSLTVDDDGAPERPLPPSSSGSGSPPTPAPPPSSSPAARPLPSPTPAGVAPGAPNRPALVTLRGVITARAGNRLAVRTPDGQRTVVIRLETRILAGESGLLLEAIRSGEASAIGHSISVTGSADPAGNIIADVIVVGPRPPQAAPAR